MAKKTNQSFEGLTGLDGEKLTGELNDAYRQLFTLRLQVATRQLQNVSEVAKTRKKIAQIKTIQRQRELVARGAEE